jgi:hypothetical protein
MTDIDGETLDALATTLRSGARGQDNAITSGELAARHVPDDGEANPTTREAIKILMRERGLPVIGGPSGYYIPESQAPVDDAIASLEGRVEGIRERQQLLAENWAEWTGHDDAAAVLTADQQAAIEADPVLTVDDVLAHREESDV